MFNMADLYPAAPEIFILTMTCVTLLVGLFAKNSATYVYQLVQLILLITIVLLLQRYHLGGELFAFSGSFILDPLAIILKTAICIVCIGALIYSREFIRGHIENHNEYYLLVLFSLLGMMVLVSAQNFLVLYLGLELLSLPLYTLVAMRRDCKASSEAAMKYFVMGAIASAMLLYGISFVFAATQSIDFYIIAQQLSTDMMSDDLLLLLGLVFILVGILFKLGIAPFHMWVPDVYQGAPSAIVLFISSAPKIAAVGMALRILAEVMPDLSGQWQQLLILSAIVSIALGNIAAIAQTNIKRMLAYSSIAHMGFMLLGLLAATPEGNSAAVFYSLIYALMSLGVFAIILLLGRDGIDAENIDDFRGLNTRNPWLAFIMFLLMFSMAGIPPTVGFVAKLGVIKALIDANFIVLAVAALLLAVIGAFYYLRIIKVMYFDTPEELTSIELSRSNTITLSINGLLVLLLGLFPGSLLAICYAIFA